MLENGALSLIVRRAEEFRGGDHSPLAGAGVGNDSNHHNLLQEGRPFIMRLQQLVARHT